MDNSDLILQFSVDIEPIRTNEMYQAVKTRAKNKSGWAVMARTNALKKYQKVMREKILPEVLPEDKTQKFRYLFNTGVFDVEVTSIHYVYYNRFYDFDVSNLIKSYEDCIARHLGIDDCYTSKYIVEKVPTKTDEGWRIDTTMKLVKKSPLTS